MCHICRFADIPLVTGPFGNQGQIKEASEWKHLKDETLFIKWNVFLTYSATKICVSPCHIVFERM